MGLMSWFYVIEIKIKPWDPKLPSNKSYIENPNLPEICPLFRAEDGEYYIRLNTTNKSMSPSEQSAHRKQEVEVWSQKKGEMLSAAKKES